MIRGEALDVILRLQNLAAFSAGMRTAAGEIKAVGAEAKAQTGETEAAMAAATKGAKVLGAAVVLAMFEGYKASVKFQDTMMQVHTNANAPIGDIKHLSNAILDMAHTVPQGPGALAHALLDARKVTQDSASALEATGIAAKGAAIGHADLEDTVKALTAAQRVGLVGANDFHHAMAVIWATTAQGGMTMQDFINALGTQLLPVAKIAGLSLTQVGGALAILTDEGQRADSAATHLRMGLSLMMGTSQKSKDALASIGLAAEDVGVAMHGPKGLIGGLDLIKQHLDETFPLLTKQIHNLDLNDPKSYQQAVNLVQQNRALLEAFGGARSSATVMLFLNQLDLLGKKTAATDAQVKNFDKAWVAYNQTAYARLHRAWSGIQADLIRFGDSFRDYVTPVIIGAIVVVGIFLKGLLLLTGVWASLPKPIQDVAFVIFMVAGALLATYGAILATDAAIGFSILLWGILGDAILAVAYASALLLDNPVLLGLAALALLVYLIATHWQEVKKGAEDVFHFLKNQLPLVALAFIPLMIFFPWITSLIVIIGIMVAHWKDVKNIMGEIGDVAKDVFGWIETASKNTLNAIISLINGVISALNILIDGYNMLPFHKDVGNIDPIGKVGSHAHKSASSGRVFGSDIFSAFAMPAFAGATDARAHSNNEKRAHTPNPVSLPDASEHPLETHLELKIGEKSLLKTVAKGTARRKAKK